MMDISFSDKNFVFQEKDFALRRPHLLSSRQTDTVITSSYLLLYTKKRQVSTPDIAFFAMNFAFF